MLISTAHEPQIRPGRGFSLLEALLVMVILGVLLALAIPDLRQLHIQRRGSLALQRLASSIYLARSAAATTGDIAVLCPSADGINCGGLWHQGILVYLDGNDNQLPDPQEKLVARIHYEKLPGKITWRAFQSKPYLQITPVGFTRYQNGNFTWCDLEKDPFSAQQLILNRTGRVRYARDTNGDGLREGANGQPINCPQ